MQVIVLDSNIHRKENLPAKAETPNWSGPIFSVVLHAKAPDAPSGEERAKGRATCALPSTVLPIKRDTHIRQPLHGLPGTGNASAAYIRSHATITEGLQRQHRIAVKSQKAARPIRNAVAMVPTILCHAQNPQVQVKPRKPTSPSCSTRSHVCACVHAWRPEHHQDSRAVVPRPRKTTSGGARYLGLTHACSETAS